MPAPIDLDLRRNRNTPCGRDVVDELRSRWEWYYALPLHQQDEIDSQRWLSVPETHALLDKFLDGEFSVHVDGPEEMLDLDQWIG